MTLNRKYQAADPEKAREYQRKYRAANPEKVKEYQRKYQAANPEKNREASRKWRAKDPEKYRETNTQKNRIWRANNPGKGREASRKWRANHPGGGREASKKWRLKNPERVSELRVKWRAENPEKVSEQAKKDMKVFREKNRDNPIYKMHQNMRSAMSHALKGKSKSAPTMKIIGCTVEELFEHLESCPSWEPWMTRKRYGAGGWDVDHIIAIGRWDEKCPLQFVLCWEKSNLQPLEHIENIKKGKK
jgi:hypothetical protein